MPGVDNVIVWVVIPEKYTRQRREAAVDKCNVELKKEDVHKGKTITIRGICDNQQEETQSYFFHFKTATAIAHWDSSAYRMPSLQVLFITFLYVRITLRYTL
jgi:hypothetical protein